MYRHLDVTSPAAWDEVVAETAEGHGGIDGLVNNAGITHRARLGSVTLEDWNRVLAVNVTGALLGIQAVMPVLRRGGSIVNVGSVAGLTAHYTVAYTASKWALRGLSRVASMELGPRGIRVNTIHPGYIETAMTASAPPAFLEASLKVAPLARAGTPDDVAPLVGFLLSDESAYLSGRRSRWTGAVGARRRQGPVGRAAAGLGRRDRRRGRFRAADERCGNGVSRGWEARVTTAKEDPNDA